MSKRRYSSQKQEARKKQKLSHPIQSERGPPAQIPQPLLAHCYHQVKTLKNYLLDALPASSRVRRKRLLSLIDSTDFAQFFDTTLVGVSQHVNSAAVRQRQQDLFHFTQTLRSGHALTATAQHSNIEEVPFQTRLGDALTIE